MRPFEEQYPVISIYRYRFGLRFFRASEGKTVEVPYRGDVINTVQDILGGLRSACTYTGAAKLKELPRRATFIRCTQQANPIYSTITVKQ